YVIGQMLELGSLSENEHRKLGERLAGSRADIVYLFGSATEAAAQAIGMRKPTFRYDDMEILSAALRAFVEDGDLVLLKGSRGTALERLTDLLVSREETTAAKGA
ncbi:MAG: UDP-N-acetylmuramoyl-tripeptide--D-alanyl-D-alanine ligase, partial [Treponemataceae bacterium]